MSKNYEEWVAWLEERSIMPQIRPGLKHTEAALTESGLLNKVNPKNVIHIAGTNGKGTTAKTLEQLLLSQGKTVGLYTSPHLVETTERIRLNGEMISKQALVSACEKFQPLIEKWNLSHFESLTLFSVALFFDDSPVDYAIYEIGLGGTWDATNVIPHQTSVITTLGFDHQHILGDTLSEIAENKFGIIKKNNHVFHLPYEEDIENQLKDKIEATSSTAVRVLPPEVVIEKSTHLPVYSIKHQQSLYPLSLPGPRAAQNMELALQVFSNLGYSYKEGLSVLKNIDWPARMTPWPEEMICPVYLSGDHNLQGIESLKEILSQSNYRQVFVLFGLSKNRIHRDFLKALKSIPRSQLYLTKPQFNGVQPEKGALPFFEKPIDGLNAILEKVQPEDLVVVTGSLYLCGDLLKSRLN